MYHYSTTITVQRLGSTSIVSVHEIGRESDRIYIVSDYVEGLTLTEWLTGQRPTVREATELCVTIAGALHHAHQNGVIHRDLKPGNVMLDRNLQPHIMDFGLAKRETGEITMTIDGQVLGTPAYMSPEQARGDSHGVDRRADIYSLGVILFELLTGERPFRGAKQMLLHQLLTEDAPSPRSLDPTIPRDLETICLKCLAREPSRRYASASELQGDLRFFLKGEAITARPMSRTERAWRWCQRHPVRVLEYALTAVVLLLAVLGGVVWFLNRAYENERGARHRLAQANTRMGETLADEQRQRGIAESEKLLVDTAHMEAEKARMDEERQRQTAKLSRVFQTVCGGILFLLVTAGTGAFGIIQSLKVRSMELRVGKLVTENQELRKRLGEADQ